MLPDAMAAHEFSITASKENRVVTFAAKVGQKGDIEDISFFRSILSPAVAVDYEAANVILEDSGSYYRPTRR